MLPFCASASLNVPYEVLPSIDAGVQEPKIVIVVRLYE